MYQGKQFLEEMTKAASSYEASKAIEAKYTPRHTRTKEGQRRLRFADNSYVIVSDKEGIMELPIQFA